MTESTTPPIVCDMSTAIDTPEERLAEYRSLFGDHLLGRERTGAGIRFRFRAAAGVADHVRDLAVREKACCAFFDFEVDESDGQVVWGAKVVDDSLARRILDDFYDLPETLDVGVEGLLDRFDGLEIIGRDLDRST